LTLTRRSGALLVLAAGGIFSFGALFFRATDNINAWQYLTFRGLGAALVVGPVLWWQNRSELAAIRRRLPWQHGVAGVLLGSMMISFIVSLTYTDAAFVLLFQAAAPITAAVFSWLLLRERLEKEAAIASVTTIFGVVIMVSSGLDSGIGWAILIVAVIPAGLGVYSTLIRAGVDGDPLVPVLIAGFTCAIVGAIVSLAGEGLGVSLRDLSISLLAGALLIGVPLPFFNWAQRAVPAPDATLLLMSEIVLGPIWVWLAYDETPAKASLIGGVIILGSVVWLTLQASTDERDVRTSRG
jgi:drug/metabolite transporter (DMT)-like permease